MLLPLAAVGLTVVGSIGSWVTFDGIDGFDKNGLDGDGVITLVLALVVGVLLLAVRLRNRAVTVITWICVVLALAVALYDVIDVAGTDLGPIDASVGWGLWLTLLGTLGLAVALVAARRSTPTPPSTLAGAPPT